MPGGPACTFCDGEEAATLNVMVWANGESVNVGPGCLPTYGLVMAQVPPPLVDKVQAYIDRLVTKANPDAGDGTAVVEPSPDQGPPDASPTDAPGAGPRRRSRSAGAQQQRVAAELAERPDAAASSGDVITPDGFTPPAAEG